MKILKLSAASFLAVSLSANNNFSGGLKLGYQQSSKGVKDLSIGVKLGYISYSWHNLSIGATLYSSTALNWHEGAEIPFFDSSNKSFAILSEAYLKGSFKDTQFKLGRQQIDTPFADSDDIGMVPNSFEALTVQNSSLKDTRFTFAYLYKMSGVDAEIPEKFSKINGSRGAWAAGAAYSGIKNLQLAAWYYNINGAETDKIAYAETLYENSAGSFSYSLALQYAWQHYKNAKAAKIYGISVSAGYKGINLLASFNKCSGNSATNGFGGGPFFTSAEHLTIAEASKNSKAYGFGIEYDASNIGLEGLSLSANKLILKSEEKIKSNELDIGINYAFNDNLELNAIFSRVNDKINSEKFNNTRVFVNYKF